MRITHKTKMHFAPTSRHIDQVLKRAIEERITTSDRDLPWDIALEELVAWAKYGAAVARQKEKEELEKKTKYATGQKARKEEEDKWTKKLIAKNYSSLDSEAVIKKLTEWWVREDKLMGALLFEEVYDKVTELLGGVSLPMAGDEDYEQICELIRKHFKEREDGK